MDVLDPSTGQVFAELTVGGASEIDATVQAAHQALDECSATTPALRGRLLRKLSALICAAPDRRSHGRARVVTPFDSAAEALQLANATEYGLIAAVWTNDVALARRIARDIRVGQTYLDTDGAGGGVELPFGGVRKSGHGREMGFEGLVGCTRVKSVVVRI